MVAVRTESNVVGLQKFLKNLIAWKRNDKVRRKRDMPEMWPTQHVALILKIGFLLGYFDVSDVVTWADILIERGRTDERILSLALSETSKESDIVERLTALVGRAPDHAVAAGYFLGLYQHILRKDKSRWKEIEGEMLRYLYVHQEILDTDETLKRTASILNNDYSLRREKLPAPLKMPDDLLALLKPYDGYPDISRVLSEQVGLKDISISRRVL